MTQTSGGPLDALLLPLLIVFGVGAVAIIVWLFWALTRSKRAAPIPAETPAQLQLTPHQSPPQAPESAYLVGLRRDVSGRAGVGGWAIEIEGKPYASLDAVPNPVTRDQVVAALRALADFSGDHMHKATAVSAPAAPQTVAPPAVPRPAERLSGATLPDAAAFRREVAPGATMPIIDLAKEIGDIVEEMVESSPTLRSRTIRLQNVPGHGVAFVVDGTSYRELGEIPDLEVQTLIRKATKEWERR